MIVLPLHCVVMEVGSKEIKRYFADHEYILAEDIRRELTNGVDKPGLDETIRAEILRRAEIKIRHGERVVVQAREFDKNRRVDFARKFSAMGVPVFYLVSDQDKELMRGDGVAEAIDASKGIEIIRSIPSSNTYEWIKNRYDGITVVGDVHGMHGALQSAVSWAQSRNHYLVFLGDIVDYGPNALECVDEVYRLVMRGKAMFILGNHERKIMRWIDGHRVRLSEGNRITTSAIASLGEPAKQKWIGRFRGLYQNGSLVRRIGNVAFAHAAAHPAIWRDAPVDRYIENHAFFGEIDSDRQSADKPLLSHRWVDSIPEDHVVVVGHEIRSSQAPIVQQGRLNGRALFLDTGCGKGGVLSSADFKFTENGMQHQNFNTY